MSLHEMHKERRRLVKLYEAADVKDEFIEAYRAGLKAGIEAIDRLLKHECESRRVAP